MIIITFLSFASLGRLETVIKQTFIKLRNSRLTNSAVRPSIFPSADRQLSSTSSRTWNIRNYITINYRIAFNHRWKILKLKKTAKCIILWKNILGNLIKRSSAVFGNQIMGGNKLPNDITKTPLIGGVAVLQNGFLLTVK